MNATTIDTDLVRYSTATELARAWEKHSTRIRDLIVQLGEECDALKAAFAAESVYESAFTVRVTLSGESHPEDATPARAAAIVTAMQRAAWRVLIEKLGIRKMMSAKRAKEMDSDLYRDSYRRNSSGRDEVIELPAINAETIAQVIGGFCASAEQFLEEAIHEQYDFWKPERRHADYKRNSEFKLNHKIIRPYVVECKYGGGFWTSYHNEQNVRALDQIFHLLSGRGPLPGCDSPLVEAIRSSGKAGIGETEFFRFKCHKNSNLHLEFKRIDLLEKFNAIAGRNRLPLCG